MRHALSFVHHRDRSRNLCLLKFKAQPQSVQLRLLGLVSRGHRPFVEDDLLNQAFGEHLGSNIS